MDNIFSNTKTILSILMVIPVTSATVERANSALKSVKTQLRSNMVEDSFNSLIFLYIHRDIFLDYDKIIDM